MDALINYVKQIFFQTLTPQIAGFAVNNYIIVLGFFAFCYLIGNAILHRFTFNNIAERIVFSISAGITLIGTIAFLFGFIGILKKQYFVPFLLIYTLLPYAFILLRKTSKIEFSSMKKSFSLEINSAVSFVMSGKGITTILCIVIIIGLLLPLLVLPLFPPTGFDDGTFHLQVPKHYFESGKISLIKGGMAPTYAIFTEVIYTLFFFFNTSGILCQIFEFILFILIGVILLSFANRFYNKKVGVIAAALWISSPLVLWQSRFAYIDIAFTFFILIAVYALLIYVHHSSYHFLVLCGSFLGIACSIKYNGLVFCGIIGLIVIYYSIRRNVWKDILLYGLPIIIFLLPCFGFNFLTTGNPVFPYYPEIFGSRIWPMKDSLIFMNSIVSGYGVPKTIKNFIFLPIYLIFKPELFFGEGPINVCYLFLLPFIIIFELRKSKTSSILFIIGSLFVLYWFTGSQVLRYIGVVLPLFALLSASIIYKSMNFLFNKNTQYIPTLLISIVLANFAMNWGIQELNTRPSLPISKNDVDKYLDAYMFPYEGVQWLNLHDPDSTCYQLYAENLAFYSDFAWDGTHYGYNSYNNIVISKKTGKELYDSLKNMGADYFLYTSHRYKYDLPNDEYFNAHFIPVWADSAAVLYKLNEFPVQERIQDNLLLDPNFEAIDSNNLLTKWSSYGFPMVLKSKYGNSVAVSKDDIPYQVFNYGEKNIKPGDLLKFTIDARCMGDQGNGEIFISWMQNGQFITSSLFPCQLTSEKKSFSYYVTAKDNANGMVVHLRTSAGKILVSNITLCKVNYNYFGSDIQ